ncbi:beta-1,6-N-acetylglucosaminyltransferase [Rhodopila globiformis]|uniref:Glycosyl transferase n=1 Tax=Rhodopila globiformis TaxID=1071 RepID=A0A2S6N1J4_RHOGL|nr:beta-1,6-N-acetylglucosaminyltransferase [Rhodopila globiformis]PPQ28468.1 hypothetical protein CCS01_24345 [Rhodopila globiformis]
MRIACLVLAYAAAPVLKVAIPLMRTAGFDVFVHVDAKLSRLDYATGLGESAAQCQFVEHPVRVYWGGYSMIQAEIGLIETARAAGPYDKYILLSDDSLPAVPPLALQAHFANEEDQVAIHRQDQASPFHARYRDFFCYDHDATSIRGRSGDRNSGLRLIDEDLEHKIAEIAVLRRIGKKEIPVYYGSQFWGLTSRSVDVLLDTLSSDLHLRKSFEYSALPDETMFQSILGNYLYNRRLDSGPVYVDFSGGGPRVISRIGDLPRDLQKSHAFIRKFSSRDPTFLQAVAFRLSSGLTILGGPVGSPPPLQQTIDDLGRHHVVIRLCAPERDPGPAWHGIESFWGRRFRWTASERVTWEVNASLPPGVLRFVIVTVISCRSEWQCECRLRCNDISMPLQAAGGEFFAEIEHDGLQVDEVELITPALISPSETSGSSDRRKLGLSIAL